MASKTAQGGPRYADYEARSRATQQHILDSAVEVLIEFGYSGASTLKIQKRAGVSRGRLLHQYPDRDTLLVAAVQHIAEARLTSTMSRDEWPAAAADRIDAAVSTLWSTYHQGYFWAATELWLAARSNVRLAEALVPKEQALGGAIRSSIDEMFGPELTAHRAYVDLRELLNTSMRGVALTYTFDPRDPALDPHVPTWQALARRELEVERRPSR